MNGDDIFIVPVYICLFVIKIATIEYWIPRRQTDGRDRVLRHEIFAKECMRPCTVESDRYDVIVAIAMPSNKNKSN